jgi:uncharacterized protein
MVFSKQMGSKVFIIFSSLFLIFFLYPNASRSQQIPGSGLAKVEAEFLPIHSTNSPESEILRTLKKGDVVRVQMEIIGAEGKWCIVSEETKKASLGFVFCKDLKYLDLESKITPQSVEKMALTAPLVEGQGPLNAGASDKKGNILSSAYLGSLLQAVWKGDISAVKELVEKGVDPNAQTRLGTRPLHVASKKRETEITSMLIASGADVNSKDQNGKTPLMEAASAGQPANAQVLLSAGANINAVDEKGFTALMWATMVGSPEVIEVLLESGAEVNIRSKNGGTALWLSQKMVENTSTSLAKAFKTNSNISEMQAKLANHKIIFQMLKEAGGRE